MQSAGVSDTLFSKLVREICDLEEFLINLPLVAIVVLIVFIQWFQFSEFSCIIFSWYFNSAAEFNNILDSCFLFTVSHFIISICYHKFRKPLCFLTFLFSPLFLLHLNFLTMLLSIYQNAESILKITNFFAN